MEHELRTHILTCASRYERHTGIGTPALSRMASGNPRFLDQIREGEIAFTVRLYDRTMNWFASAWPSGLKWPAAVPRPKNIDPARIAPRKRRNYRAEAEVTQ